jgi:acetyltransferase EpsM
MVKINTYIYGASGHGKVILDILEARGIKVYGFIDDDIAKISFSGLHVYRYEQLNNSSSRFILGIGLNHTRKSVAEKVSGHFITAVHPSVVVSRHSDIGEGSAIMQMATIQAGTTIGRHCILNTNASVDHDCNVGDFVHISPGAIICGDVKIGELTWVGAGATIINGITIGKNVTIGAGSVIINNVPDNVTVVGNPGRIVKTNDK